MIAISFINDRGHFNPLSTIIPLQQINILKVKHLIYTILFLLIYIPGIYAQDSRRGDTLQIMGMGGFALGYGYMNVSKLHSFIPENSHKFSNNMVLVGGAGHSIINHLVVGGGGFGLIGDAINTDSIKASIGGGFGSLDIGYLIINKKKMKLYPMIGLGAGGFGLQILSNNRFSIGNKIKEPGKEMNINQNTFISDISLNLDLIPFIKNDESQNSYGGFLTSLRLGYIYSFPKSKWKFSDNEIIYGPKFGMNMIYFKLIIGGFGYQKK